MKPNGNINRSSATATRPAISRPPTAEERRRAQRVLLRMPVVVHIPNRAEPMQAETHTVSQNGGMILVTEAIGEGSKVTLENPRNQKRVDARVVRPPQIAQGGSLVPVEFTTPSPTFWAVFFPPALN
ncbi:MAG: PilZ domain-containing protein [Acidobacteriota bacterium]|nr:PilZ domain-containing protein [Acidobacteriota bacterium]